MSLSFRPLMSVAIIIVIIAACAFFSWWSARRHRPFRTSDLVRRGAITCALLSILIGPSVPGEAQKVTTNVEVWLAIDRTGSMAAEDWEGGKTRLQGVSHDVEQILQAAPGARYRIITWDSAADTELPLTSDLGAVRSFVSTLTQEVSSSSRGSSPDRPAQYIAEEMQAAANKHPENTRVLFVFTDGETSNNSAWRSAGGGDSQQWDKIKPLLTGGLVIGYGTEEGGKMKVAALGKQNDGSNPEYIKDFSQPGNPDAISKIDVKKLSEIAQKLGIDMVRSPNDSAISSAASSSVQNARNIADANDTIQTSRYVLWPSALVLTALLAWEAAIFAGRIHALRRTRAI